MFTNINPFVTMSVLSLSYALFGASILPMVPMVVPNNQLGTAYGLLAFCFFSFSLSLSRARASSIFFQLFSLYLLNSIDLFPCRVLALRWLVSSQVISSTTKVISFLTSSRAALYAVNVTIYSQVSSYFVYINHLSSAISLLIEFFFNLKSCVILQHFIVFGRQDTRYVERFGIIWKQTSNHHLNKIFIHLRYQVVY